MLKKLLSWSFLLFTLLIMSGCLSPKGATIEEKRTIIQNMKKETLDLLYKQRPTSRDVIAKSAGYAVFSNINAQILWVGGAGGYGVAVDQVTGENTYMKMAQVGLGLGLGVQDIRVVFVFLSQRALDNFIIHGWDFGGQADAAAKAEDKGGAVSGEVSIDSETIIYTMSEAGLMAKVNLAGTKYWKDNELNQ